MEASTYKDKIISVLVVFQVLPNQEEDIIGQRQRHDQETDSRYGLKNNATQSGGEQRPWARGFKNRPQALACQDSRELIFCLIFPFSIFSPTALLSLSSISEQNSEADHWEGRANGAERATTVGGTGGSLQNLNRRSVDLLQSMVSPKVNQRYPAINHTVRSNRMVIRFRLLSEPI